jgi:hypothetical protein
LLHLPAACDPYLGSDGSIKGWASAFQQDKVLFQILQRGGGRNKGGGKVRTDAWLHDPAELNNATFTAYYKAQNILPEDEWEDFMTSMRAFLPTTFRVAGSRQYVSNEFCMFGF